MKCCPHCTPEEALCDFCVWFDFNGDADGAYTGDGFCRRHSRPADPCDACEDYECFLAPEADPEALKLHLLNKFKPS